MAWFSGAKRKSNEDSQKPNSELKNSVSQLQGCNTVHY